MKPPPDDEPARRRLRDGTEGQHSPSRHLAPAASDHDELTGLPWLRTWRGVYLAVFGIFLLWIGLLTALTRMFS
ncbi:MAG: hypothetical protein EXS39_04380 [Opitutaceae bacterium]|nr:hypothetical protein [Opitutaceae bacterium]